MDKTPTSASVSNEPEFATFLPFLMVICFLTFLSILSRMVFAPLTPLICKEMGLCHGETGHLFLVLSIGFAVTLFLSQYINCWISHKKTIAISLYSNAFLFLSTPWIGGYASLCSFLFFVGLASGLFIPSSIAIIRKVIFDNHLGKAFGMRQAMQSCAFIFGPAMVSIFSPYLSWRFILLSLGVFFLIFSVLFSIFFKEGQDKSPPVSMEFFRGVLTMPSFWIMLLLLCLISGMNYGVYNMAPNYYDSQYDVDRSTVNTLIMVARIFSFFTAILSGFLADKIGMRKALFSLLLICGLTTFFLGISSVGVSLFLFILQSSLATALMSLIHLAIANIVPAHRSASIISMMAPFAFIFGSGIVPKVIGIFADKGMYSQAFALFGIIAIAAALFFNWSRVHRHIYQKQVDS
ncbi:hypothetical protein COB21_06150 [Candidatus Aerophobetes bacterium]|uniref:Major facilitator superfamily (MFS) profile domain-containing protein n=1 Tax=Aerophobetes bacterium TaxID=2030807 RepID=A0A2A4WXK7_UNCAE|nr:MAG: hypothetical protein COB21_06150 [Candidatus Aerophobetes bacterium]